MAADERGDEVTRQLQLFDDVEDGRNRENIQPGEPDRQRYHLDSPDKSNSNSQNNGESAS